MHAMMHQRSKGNVSQAPPQFHAQVPFQFKMIALRLGLLRNESPQHIFASANWGVVNQNETPPEGSGGALFLFSHGAGGEAPA
jgi:hypothetical protein